MVTFCFRLCKIQTIFIHVWWGGIYRLTILPKGFEGVKAIKKFVVDSIFIHRFQRYPLQDCFFCGFMWGCRISLRSKFVPY